jgi:biotin transport system substrate-specific component
MQKRKFSIRNMCYCAIFAALMAICAQIHIPFASTHITLQTFAIFLALLTLGGFRGTVSVGLYLLLGAIGLPVFAGFRGGLHLYTMESGGFLIGFMLTSLLYWAITAEFRPKKWGKVVTMAIAMIPCYSLGIYWMYRFYSIQVMPSTYLITMVTFLIPDCLKFWLAWIISKRLQRFVK